MSRYNIAFLFLLLCSCREQPTTKQTTTDNSWAMTGFVKVDSLNPILQPDSTQQFLCPVSKQTMNWEERNVLNPSAVVKDGKVYLLYRAQDRAMTSRLGLAVSEDGLHFTKQPQPVFFPANDSMQTYEWKGGVEDPRVVESEDGTYIVHRIVP